MDNPLPDVTVSNLVQLGELLVCDRERTEAAN